MDELNLVFQNFKKNEVDFYFTTRVEKQNILNILPDKIRKKHSEKAFDEIFEMLYSLLNSDSSVKMDIALELLEWITLGLSDSELSLHLYNKLFPTSLQLNQDFLNYFLLKYDSLLKDGETASKSGSDE